MAEGRPLSFDVGHTVTVTKTISDDDIVAFTRASGDTHAVHLDDAHAAQTRFGRRVAHGVLSAGLVSAAIGTRLPGPNESVVYLTQNCQFRAPVYPGDTVTATVKVTKINARRCWVTLATTVTNQEGAVVMSGEAEVMIDPFPYRE